MDVSPGASPISVRVLALPESSPAVVYGVYEVLHAVGTAWSHVTGESSDVTPLDVRIAGRSSPLQSFLDIPVAPHVGLEPAAPGIAIVCDINLPRDADPRGRWPREATWLASSHAAGTLVCSVCTGSLVLADAGLLEGVEATTHWVACDVFSRYYPGVRLNAARVLLPAGPEHRIVTSGGAASWEDLVLYIVARFCGEAEARRLAKVFVLGDRSEGQLPFAAVVPRRHDDAVVAQCEAWIRERLADPNPVGGMIRQSGLPERTFKRRFASATGASPLDYVHTLRIEAAKQRLETTSEATADVAAAVGYDDPAFFRRLFKRRTGVTPARYRTRFRALVPRS
jgi:transcriptional regulator GlxA family with amidase domain